ncbi:hypothetical protein ACC840_36330, partial [Rhizobium ruizarguesonis]
PAVNVASRLETLTKEVKLPVLLSRAFVEMAIWHKVTELSGGKPLTVSLSGGNPAIKPLRPLIELGHSQGYRFALETQGSVAQAW